MPRDNPRAMRHSSGHDQNDIECSVSEKYDAFISKHIEVLRQKCKHFAACISKLLEDENPVNILRGDDIKLNKTCGLVYKNGSNKYDTLDGLCTQEERGHIKADIESHLPSMQGWKKVDECLENKFGDKEREENNNVDAICKLAKENKWACSKKIHNQIQSFFNDQMLHLKCTCQNLNKQDDDHHSHAPLYAAAAAGAGFVLLILLIVGFIVYRRRKAKRRKKNPNVIYLPAPNADNNPVYQEVYDDRFYNSGHPSSPPTLPMRYTRDPTSRPDDDPTYLEPVEPGFRPKLPPMRGAPVANPSYGAPPEYSEKAEDSVPSRPSDSENGYFQPLPPPPGDRGNAGYETIESMQPAPPPPSSPPKRSASEKPSESRPQVDQSELTRSASDKPSTGRSGAAKPSLEKWESGEAPSLQRSESDKSEGARLLSGERPVPAKRTKKEEPKIEEELNTKESPYFLLEREESTV